MYPAAVVGALVPYTVVTWIWSYPALSAGVVKVNEVAVTPDGVTAVPPMVTVMPATNPLPLTVTAWPPLTGPADGVTELILAASRSWSACVQVNTTSVGGGPHAAIKSSVNEGPKSVPLTIEPLLVSPAPM